MSVSWVSGFIAPRCFGSLFAVLCVFVRSCAFCAFLRFFARFARSCAFFARSCAFCAFVRFLRVPARLARSRVSGDMSNCDHIGRSNSIRVVPVGKLLQ